MRSNVSIHAPVKGATEIARRFPAHIDSFNPRSREGSDIKMVIATLATHVSIHAPVKGATRGYSKATAIPYVSIHAPVKGATCPGVVSIVGLPPFQSTLP